MGANMVLYAQMYKPSIFSGFRVHNVLSTWNADSLVTDSAASGTALATGTKTLNGRLGMDRDGNRLTSVAEILKSKGRRISIVTTVGANSATPAAFYAHRKSRKDMDRISMDLFEAGFDFYAGSGLDRGKKDFRVEDFDYESEAHKAGYTLVRSTEECKASVSKAQRILFLPDKNHKVANAIDRREGREHTSLADMVECSVDFFMKKGCQKGFFIMAEGGKIDHFTHGNDAAGAVKEILDLDDALKVAMEFYRKHPDETAIILTSDHDTGGCCIRPQSADIASILDGQKNSAGTVTRKLKKIMESETPEWEEIKSFLSENLGLWSNVKVNPKDEADLKRIYDKTIAVSKTGNVSDDFGYNNNAVIVSKAVEILNSYAGISWGTRSHSGGYVPFYYLGPRPEMFTGVMANSSLAPKILSLAM